MPINRVEIMGVFSVGSDAFSTNKKCRIFLGSSAGTPNTRGFVESFLRSFSNLQTLQAKEKYHALFCDLMIIYTKYNNTA